ncbi:MAG: hypothetical protein GXP18_01415 [Gammaproteobacteria bacterium]|nr:hypothetical protein [Gammaproteobacteria bacterium]
MNNDHYVAAIAVVDLARELKRNAMIDLAQLRALDSRLASYVLDLENNLDVSELLGMRYPEKLLMTLWQIADQATVNRDIGILVGATISQQTQGLLSRMMTHCDTLEDVLDTYLSNIAFVNAAESWVVQRTRKKVALTFSFAPGKDYPRCAVERSMVSLHHLGRHYCQADIPLDSVEFAYPEPDYSHRLKEQFSCDIIFNSHRHALIMNETVLSQPLPQRNHYMKNILGQKISDVNMQVVPDSTEKKVRDLLRNNLSDFCSVDRLANTLCMSRTTLYRKLKAEGSSFSRLVDEERQKVLILHQHVPVATLCDLMGFKDVSAYYKARKRWGTLPVSVS